MEQLPQDIQTPLLSSLSDIFELGRLSLVNKGYNQLVQHSPLWDIPLNLNPPGSIFRLTSGILSISGGFARMKPKSLRDIRKFHFAFHRSFWIPFSYKDLVLPLCRPFLEILDLYAHVKLSSTERHILPAVLAGMNVICRNTELGTFFAFLVGTIQGLISGDGVAVIVNSTIEKNNLSQMKDIEKLAKPLCLSCCDCSVSAFPTETDRIILGTAEQLQSCIENHHIKNTQIRFCIILDSRNDFKSHPIQSFLSLLTPSTQFMVHSNCRNILSTTSEKKLFRPNSGVLKIESDVKIIRDFENLNLEEKLLRGVYIEFDQPSAILQQAILPAMQGEDIAVQYFELSDISPCYTISTLHQIDPSKTTIQTLIILQNQTAIQQIHTLFNNVGQYLNIKTTAISEIPNDFSIPEGIHVVITGYKLYLQLVKNGILKIQELKILVLDEISSEKIAAEIFQHCPTPCQVQIYTKISSEWEPNNNLEKYIHRPLKFIVENNQRNEKTLEGMRQFYIQCEREVWKFDTLMDLMDTVNLTSVVLYCNTRKKMDWLFEKLTEKNFRCGMVHRGMDRQQLNDVHNQFRMGSTNFLISCQIPVSNTMGSGVILLYDPPLHCEDYVNMIGRSGKFGRKGVVILFIVEGEIEKLRRLEQFYSATISELPANIDDYIYDFIVV